MPRPLATRGMLLTETYTRRPGLRDALDLPDDGFAIEILQFDLEIRTAILELGDGIATDVAFILQNVENAGAQFRTRRRNAVLAAHLRVTNTGEHIAQRIGHRHVSTLPLPA